MCNRKFVGKGCATPRLPVRLYGRWLHVWFDFISTTTNRPYFHRLWRRWPRYTNLFAQASGNGIMFRLIAQPFGPVSLPSFFFLPSANSIRDRVALSQMKMHCISNLFLVFFFGSLFSFWLVSESGADRKQATVFLSSHFQQPWHRFEPFGAFCFGDPPKHPRLCRITLFRQGVNHVIYIRTIYISPCYSKVLFRGHKSSNVFVFGVLCVSFSYFFFFLFFFIRVFIFYFIVRTNIGEQPAVPH